MNSLVVSLHNSSFQSDPPTFTLTGVSRGPPTNNNWTRNGQLISGGDAFSVSLRVTSDSLNDHLSGSYTSTLIVTGNYPGVYEYTAANRVNTEEQSDSIMIEGTY